MAASARGLPFSSIPSMEFTVLTGPSGRGKSTLLHLVGGRDHPTSGEVWLNGQRVDTLKRTELADLRLRRLGFIFQAYNPIPVLTVLDNAAFVLELRRLPTKEREAKARRALETLGMARPSPKSA